MTITYRLACVAALVLLAGCSGNRQPAAAAPPQAAEAAATTSLPAEGSPTAPAAPAEDAAAAAAPPAAAAAIAMAGPPAESPPTAAAAPAREAGAATTGLPTQTAPAAPAPAALAPAPAPPAGSASAAAMPADDANTYVIGAGDSLNVFVYDTPQLSMAVPVRPDGRISTPLVPEMMAAGKTPTQLAKDITERLKEYVKDPNVTIMVSGFVGPLSRQVRIIGEATDPQAIPYRDHMTVLDVMIQTKGLTRFAAGNRAMIVRGEGDKQEKIRVRLSDLLKDGDISQNVEMRPGDTLIIPQTWF